MMTDPIADMLARVRNAVLARHDRTEMPLSTLKKAIAELLKEEGYISDVRVDDSGHGKLILFLKYGRDRESAIAGLRRRSRPGRREYVGYTDIPKVHNGMGVAILSTSRGLMTDKTARAQKMGGELLCEVW
ncbi:MAG: 30S ribosomal protein S8 [Sandaracinaceae bacterium]|nr:30S ribosomal protein S8 [Sandaracinaceae bacterium]MCC6876253.1 30S ribosomal protein S8 [Sandaracinaceae bacterium]